jgi:hypothetical protein
MTALHYLIDENIGPHLRSVMHKTARQITVWCVGDAGAPQRGAKDPEILRWCQMHDFILVTDNRRTMPVHLQQHLATGAHVPGILVLPAKLTMKEIIDELVLIWEASLPNEYQDQIRYLPVSR